MDRSTYRRVVTDADTAAALDPALPPVASTPFVLALAEGACLAALDGKIGADQLCVGARAEIDHLGPSAVGAELVATAAPTFADAPKYGFDVEVHDGDRVVARVKHVRAIVPRAAVLGQLA